jgi:hypothetical protein
MAEALKTADTKKSKYEWLYIVLLILIPFVTFIAGADYPFMLEWDDSGLITENTRLIPSFENFKYFLSDVTYTQMIFSPALMYSLMLDRWLFGLNALGYHIHNILLHSIAALLLYGIARHLGIRSWIAFFIAVLWAVHPQRVESVIWITERKDVLAGVFSFAAMLTFMRAFDRRQIPYWAIVLLLLAMATKPSTLTMPGIMVIYALCRRREWGIAKYLWPVVTATMAFYVYSYIVSHANMVGTADVMPRLLLVPLHNAFWYLITAVVPFELNPIYPRVGFDLHTLGVLTAGAILVAAGAAAPLLYKISWKDFLFKTLSFAGVWLCCFLPVSAIMMRFSNTDYCDRYNYLLSAVVWIGIGMLVEKLVSKNDSSRNLRIIITGSICIASVYIFLSISYIPAWRDTKTLFMRALEIPYPNVKAIEGLGRVGLRRNDPETLELAGNMFIGLSRESKNILLSEEVKDPVSDYYTGVFYSGMSLLKASKPLEALEVFRLAETAYYKKELRIYAADEYLSFLWSSLASCYLAAGRPDDALRCLKVQQPLLNQESADAYFCRGLIAFLQQDFQLARREWDKAYSLRPDDVNIQHNLKKVELKINSTNIPYKVENSK